MSMLDTLHRIVSAVNRSTDLQRALLLIVKQVKVAIGSDVCSIYLTEEDTKVNVLMATDGFRKEAVGKVRLPYGRGLVGLVAERAEPINLDDSSWVFSPAPTRRPSPVSQWFPNALLEGV